MNVYVKGQTIDFKFPTRNASGPASLSSGAISIYRGNSTTQFTTGVTLTADFDSVTGQNHVRIVTTDSAYAPGADFEAVISAGTVGGVSVVGEVVFRFRLLAATAVWFDKAGDDANDGLTLETAKLTPTAAVTTANSQARAQQIIGGGGEFDIGYSRLDLSGVSGRGHHLRSLLPRATKITSMANLAAPSGWTLNATPGPVVKPGTGSRVEGVEVYPSAAELKSILAITRPATKSVSSITRSGSTATATATSHGYTTGDKVSVFGAVQTEYNVTAATVTVLDANTFTYSVTGSPATPATGTITCAGATATVIMNADHGYQVGWKVTITGTSTAAFNAEWTVATASGTQWTFTCAGTETTPSGGGNAFLNVFNAAFGMNSSFDTNYDHAEFIDCIVDAPRASDIFYSNSFTGTQHLNTIKGGRFRAGWDVFYVQWSWNTMVVEGVDAVSVGASPVDTTIGRVAQVPSSGNLIVRDSRFAIVGGGSTTNDVINNTGTLSTSNLTFISAGTNATDLRNSGTARIGIGTVIDRTKVTNTGTLFYELADVGFAAGTAWNSGAIQAGTFASDAITAAKLASDAVTEIQSGLATAAALQIVDDLIDTEVAAIKAKTDQLTFSVSGQVDANALTGGGATLTITPLVASVANPFYATRDLPKLPAASGNTIVWTITDGTGAAVNLSGKTIRLVAYLTTAAGDDVDSVIDDTITASFQYATGGDGITVGGASNNQVTLVHSITKTATPGDYRYMLWNITDNTLLAKGKMPIEPSVKGS